MADTPTPEEQSELAGMKEPKQAYPGRPGFLSFGRGLNYYTGTGRRVADFIVGVVAASLLYLLVVAALGLAGISFGIIDSVLFYLVLGAIMWLLGRRWIGFGVFAFTALFIIVKVTRGWTEVVHG